MIFKSNHFLTATNTRPQNLMP